MFNLNEMLKHINSDDVIIRLHNFPDPDAIASAYGLQSLLYNMNNIKPRIIYSGKIDRESTNKMIALLDIEVFEVDSNPEIHENTTIILVDSQRGNANTVDVDSENVICIDHHPVYGENGYAYRDIRPDVGSCASIIAEYYLESGLKIDGKVATALLYGIKIDTANLTRGVSELDLDMFYMLYKKADPHKLSLLESSNLQFSDLKEYMTTIKNIKLHGSLIFANTGDDCHEALIAIISDFTLSISEVEFSIIYSIKEDGIKISTRSKNEKYDAGKITKAALEGIGSGGGHPFMAGGFVPFNGSKGSHKALIHKIEKGFLKFVKQEIV